MQFLDICLFFVKSRDGFCLSGVPCGRFKKKTTLCRVIFIFICIQDVLVNLYVLGNSVL